MTLVGRQRKPHMRYSFAGWRKEKLNGGKPTKLTGLGGPMPRELPPLMQLPPAEKVMVGIVLVLANSTRKVPVYKNLTMSPMAIFIYTFVSTVLLKEKITHTHPKIVGTLWQKTS